MQDSPALRSPLLLFLFNLLLCSSSLWGWGPIDWIMFLEKRNGNRDTHTHTNKQTIDNKLQCLPLLWLWPLVNSCNLLWIQTFTDCSKLSRVYTTTKKTLVERKILEKKTIFLLTVFFLCSTEHRYIHGNTVELYCIEKTVRPLRQELAPPPDLEEQCVVFLQYHIQGDRLSRHLLDTNGVLRALLTPVSDQKGPVFPVQELHLGLVSLHWPCKPEAAMISLCTSTAIMCHQHYS